MHKECSNVTCLSCRAHRKLKDKLAKFLEHEMENMHGVPSFEKLAIMSRLLIMMGMSLKKELLKILEEKNKAAENTNG